MPVHDSQAAGAVIIGSAEAPSMAQERAWAVAGLHCAACAGQLRERLMAVPGVQAAEVGYGAALAVVRAPAALQDELPQRLRGSGYRLAPMEAASAAELRRQESRQLLWRLFVAGFCMMQVMMLAAPTYFAEGAAMPADLRRLLHWGGWVLSWPVMLFSSQPFLVGAWRSLRQRRLGMDVPVALGALVTFGVSTLALFDPAGPWGAEIYFDSLTMFISFLLAARWFELRARHAAAAELSELVADQQAPVQREAADGRVEAVALSTVRAGDVLRVGLGEVVPVDALLLEGETQVDEALLSGESHPLRRVSGETLVGGSLNLGRPVRVRALMGAGEGRAAQLAQQLQHALTARPQAESLADRWAQPFLAGVLLLALLAAVGWAWWVSPQQAVAVACAVLIVTCPCAFALAQPAARVASHRTLARQGLLLQRLEALENLARVDRVWLDKTGTLTRPQLRPRELQSGALQWLGRAVVLASWSRHPMAQAVARCAAGEPGWRWQDVEEQAGVGLRARDGQGRWWRLGRDAQGGSGELVFGLEGEPASLVFEADEQVQPFVPGMLAELRELGMRVGLLSGDQAARVQRLAGDLGLAAGVDALGACSPEAKRERVRQDQAEGHRVLMVGDGVNDAPVLAQADASLAVTGASSLANRAADVLLLRGDLSQLPLLIRQARRTQAITRQNLVWALLYNGVAIPMALAGWLPPWAAGLGMALSSLLVVGNSLRL
ncbi:MAG: heavy metal translocating P-type ATPase [Burkholderiales bacterium]|nr:heavy metal translocating P-type ATPase [Burkholderiales bacterium]